LRDAGRVSKYESVAVLHPRYSYPPKVLRARYGWFLWQSIRRSITQTLEQFRPDAVLGYWAHPDGECAVRAAKQIGVPAIVMVGGSDILMLAKHHARRGKIRDVLKAADAVITTSNDLRTRVHELGIAPDKTHVIYRGVDTQRFFVGDRHAARRSLGLPEAHRIVLWVGRMVPVKGLDVLIRAATILKARRHDMRIHLVGDGALRRQLEASVEARGLREQVHFEPVQSHDRLPDWYRAADVTVLPSRSEGVPNVLRESLACGTPFVASNVGGIREIADPEMSVLVPPDDPPAFANAIETMLERPPTRRAQKPQCSWRDSADALVGVIRPIAAAQ
jgi:glycosyltransferase involved in cell wall biosynthesis